MRYEFYDGDGNLLGLKESLEGTSININEVITLHFKEQTENWWKVIAVSPVRGGRQTVLVRPIDSNAAE